MELIEAIEKSILKWEILAKTGEHRRYLKDITTVDMPHGCALCLYARQPEYCFEGIKRYRCRKYCPYAQRFRCCVNRGQPFKMWEELSGGDNPERIELRKKYASQFLEQLKQLRAESSRRQIT